MSEKKEKLTVGQEAAEEYYVKAGFSPDTKLLASIIDKIIEERGLGSETPDSTGPNASAETGEAEKWLQQFIKNRLNHVAISFDEGWEIIDWLEKNAVLLLGHMQGIEKPVSTPSQKATATVRKEKENL